LPTYFISSVNNLISRDQIKHFDNPSSLEQISTNFIPNKEKIRVLLTCGASCPDAVIEEIFRKLVSFFPDAKDVDFVVDQVIGQ
jgi:4-hydroxy-3-methylbut-2-enyl diphosphate reductase